jgi:hypothetical protein
LKVNGVMQSMVGFAYNAVVVDGRFGLLGKTGNTSFDSVTVKTNDTKVAALPTGLLAASAPATVTTLAAPGDSELEAIAAEAVRRWTAAEGEAFGANIGKIEVQLADLPGLELGRYVDGRVLIDRDAAGFGWFVDGTPQDDREFAGSGDVRLASAATAQGRMDLLSVVAHELGHAGGFGHTGDGLMDETLLAGVRSLEPGMAGSASAVRQPWAPAAPADTAAPSGPVAIEWGVTVTSRDPAPAKKAGPASSASWQRDFVNHLGQTEKQRNPNLGLRLHVDANGKIAPSLTSL